MSGWFAATFWGGGRAGGAGAGAGEGEGGEVEGAVDDGGSRWRGMLSGKEWAGRRASVTCAGAGGGGRTVLRRQARRA